MGEIASTPTGQEENNTPEPKTPETPAVTPEGEEGGGNAPKTPEAPAEPPKEPESFLSQDPDAKLESKEPDAKLEIKLPDGTIADEAMLKAFAGVAKEWGYDSEQASKVAGWYFQQQASMLKELNTTWRKEISEDPKYGGKNLDNSVLAVRRVLKDHGSPEIVQALEGLGVGKHPALFRLLASIGLAKGEDSGRVEGGGAPKGETGPKTRQEKYRNLYSKSHES